MFSVMTFGMYSRISPRIKGINAHYCFNKRAHKLHHVFQTINYEEKPYINRNPNGNIFNAMSIMENIKKDDRDTLREIQWKIDEINLVS